MSNRKLGLAIERAGADERSFTEVFELMLALHRQGGYATLDADKAAGTVYSVLKEEMTFVARLEGKAIGALSMTDLPFWYSQQSYLQDLGFFVKPEHRRGRVGVELLKAVRQEAQRREKIALVTVTSPDRPPKNTPMSLESQLAGFVPLGYTIKLR